MTTASLARAPRAARTPRGASTRGGGSPALERVVHRAVADPDVYRSLRRYLGSLCGDPYFAEDLAQDAIVRAIERARDFRGEGSVDGWLKAIARTTFLMAIRAKREAPACEVDNEVPSAEEEALDRLGREEARHAVGQLSGPDQRLVDLYYGLGLTINTIATMMATTECAVKCRLYRLRRRLSASHSVTMFAERAFDTGAAPVPTGGARR